MKLSFLSKLANGRATTVIALAAAVYLLLEKTGLFRAVPAKNIEILHAQTFLFIATLLGISVCAGLLSPGGAARSRAGAFCLRLSVVVLVIALWTSYFTHFEGKAIRMEEQAFNGFPNDYTSGSIYKARLGSFPRIGILMHTIAPEAAKDGAGLRKVEADITYAGPATNGPSGSRLSSRWPMISDWTLLTISDFGYMVRFLVEDPWHRPIDSDYVHMKLFPAGKEDFFKSYLLPYSFFLKLYPDYQAKNGRADSASPYLKNPVFHLRLTRNKDIIYDDVLKPTEHVKFEEFVLSMPEVRMWVEISFLRDFGVPVALVGFLLMAAGLGLSAAASVRQSKGAQQ